ncbi:MAG: 23S rRNA (pseudouridine(1915)-N(3))-methyltransferase RlmH [Lachnospiraceae bacterium]
MKISIICVGKIKEKFYKEAIEEFQKRLGRYCKLAISEVPDEKTPDRASLSEENQIRAKEGDRILKQLPNDGYVIALCIDGKQRDSADLSKYLDSLAANGKGHIVFVIGGSIGLAKEVIERADEQLSFSVMTFPHQLMRVILLEQIYRSFRISNNEPYHK